MLKTHARRFALPLMIVALLSFFFNNCGKSGGSATVASTATGNTGTATGPEPVLTTPAPAPTPAPSASPVATPVQALAIKPASAQAEPYASVNFEVSGGVAPYVIAGDFNATLAQAGSQPFLGYLPRVYNATVTDAAGTKVSFKLTVTGTLAPVVAVANLLPKTNVYNYYYTSQLEQTLTFPVTDVANGFPIYALKPPSHVRPVYVCDNGDGRQFLSPDLNCEGHPGFPFLGYLYDSATAVPGFKLKALIRIYNPSVRLHRVITEDVAVPDGFKADGVVLGYLPPRVPPEWCNRWMKCDQ